MSSREDFMRQMGISVDDVQDPKSVKTKFSTRAQQEDTRSGKSSERVVQPKAPTKSEQPVHEELPAKTKSLGFQCERNSQVDQPPPKSSKAPQESAASNSNARSDFLRSLGIDNMDAPQRASQEFVKPQPVAEAPNSKEDEGHRSFKPTIQADVLLGRKSNTRFVPSAISQDPADNATPEQLKEWGNKHFEEGDLRKAIRLYSRAIEGDVNNAALYSNRSAAYLQASKQMGIDTRCMALRDAEKAIELRSNWFKGYSRKGDALFKLERFREAADAYEKGLQFDEGNINLMHSLGEARSCAGGTKPQHRQTSWGTLGQQSTASQEDNHNRSVHEMVAELQKEVSRENPSIALGNDYRSKELERFRVKGMSCDSDKENVANIAPTTVNKTTTARNASSAKLDRSAIPEEFGSSAAAAYQQSLLEQYRRKKCAK